SLEGEKPGGDEEIRTPEGFNPLPR
ncbi:MAG: hypothetical protein RL130_276, partial [Actinomycetota bacterium]